MKWTVITLIVLGFSGRYACAASAAGEPSTSKTPAPVPATPSPSPATGAAGAKIAANESPRPQDRLYLNYRLLLEYPVPGQIPSAPLPPDSPRVSIPGAPGDAILLVNGEGAGSFPSRDPKRPGRVKVQFHWDRTGSAAWGGESCWVRIAGQPAGRAWGICTIPRIGQEVVVAFQESGKPATRQDGR